MNTFYVNFSKIHVSLKLMNKILSRNLLTGNISESYDLCAVCSMYCACTLYCKITSQVTLSEIRLQTATQWHGRGRRKYRTCAGQNLLYLFQPVFLTLGSSASH